MVNSADIFIAYKPLPAKVSDLHY